MKRLYERLLKGSKDELTQNRLFLRLITEHLAFVYRKQGRYNAEEQLLEHVVNGMRERYGPEYQNTVRIIDNLAIVYRGQGQHEKAERLYE